MAPGLSPNNLENTIAQVYETLRRTESRTYETKQRASKTLKDSSQHFTNSQQFLKSNLSPERLAGSLEYSSNTGNHERHTSGALKYSTVDNRRTPNPNRMQTNCSSVIAGNNGKEKKHPLNSKKLRTIIFKTLDRLFQGTNNKPSSSTTVPHDDNFTPLPSNINSLSLETLKLLNQNDADTLPRNSPLLPIPEKQNISTKVGASVVVQHACSYDEDGSTSSDDSNWEFIAPLKFEEVTMDDSLKSSSSRNDKIEKENDPLITEDAQRKTRKNRYQRQSRKGSEKSKIQKRALDKHYEKMQIETMRFEEAVNVDDHQKTSEKTTKSRRDSPILNKKLNEKSLFSTKSLPNLIEAIHELDMGSTSTISECGAETFTRNISYCPSSTLCNKIPSVSEIHKNKDEGCSSSSSFTSLQMTYDYNCSTRSTHESTLPVPSALCKDVLVNPIHIPIQPFKHKDHDVTVNGITARTFKEISELYLPLQVRSVSNCPPQHVFQQDNHDVKCGYDGISNLSETKNASACKITHYDECPPPSSKMVRDQDASCESGQSLNTSLNSTVPPPPPPPPPQTIPSTTIKGLLPLPIFTQRQAGNCIFNNMKDICIDEGDAKKLKEKFPLKTSGNALKRLKGRNQAFEVSPEEKKFLQNIELFLKTCRISNENAPQVIKNVIRSISALNTRNSDVEAEWFTKLAQFLPKQEEIAKMRRTKNLQQSGSKTLAGMFVCELLNVENVHRKLSCIQFSVDFKDGSSRLFKWADSFIAACNAIKMSEKFVLIINVIMGLLQSLSPDDHSKIYGFDIQGLTRLASKKAADGSTFLQFVIEYILSKPDLIDSVDFYKTFVDLPDVTKTYILEMRSQCAEWKQSLNVYTAQVEQIKRHNHISPSDADLQYATTFMVETDAKLKKIDAKLDEAQQSFDNCKESFGLMDSETSEVHFFESLSKFIMAYQQTYNDVLLQKEKYQRRPATTNASADPVIRGDSDNAKSSDDKKPRKRKSYKAMEFKALREVPKDCEEPIKPHIANPRRKSCTLAELQNIHSTSQTAEIDTCLMSLLTDNEKAGGKRMRKRCSNSPNKLLVRK